MLRILRVFKLIKLGDIIYSLDAHYSFFRVLIKGLSLLGSIVLACHLVACIWWVFSRDLTTNSWIDITSETYNTNLRDAPLEHQYVTSLYFSYITLLGIGYGDIVPANTPERIVVCVIMLCGSTLIVNITLASVSGIVRRFIAGAVVNTC